MDGWISEDYVQVPTWAPIPIELIQPELAPEVARIANDSMMEIVAQHRDRFPAFVA